jgi:hypothetical protein
MRKPNDYRRFEKALVKVLETEWPNACKSLEMADFYIEA